MAVQKLENCELSVSAYYDMEVAVEFLHGQTCTTGEYNQIGAYIHQSTISTTLSSGSAVFYSNVCPVPTTTSAPSISTSISTSTSTTGGGSVRGRQLQLTGGGVWGGGGQCNFCPPENDDDRLLREVAQEEEEDNDSSSNGMTAAAAVVVKSASDAFRRVGRSLWQLVYDVDSAAVFQNTHAPVLSADLEADLEDMNTGLPSRFTCVSLGVSVTVTITQNPFFLSTSSYGCSILW